MEGIRTVLLSLEEAVSRYGRVQDPPAGSLRRRTVSSSSSWPTSP
jgi:hypothetical protein